MPKVIVIIQARWASTRLPGKVLFDLNGTSVLGHVIKRCAAIKGIAGVCCAIPTSADSDPIARDVETHGAYLFRGDEQDVLGRFYHAARDHQADIILRVTSDCPLVDPALCGEVIALLGDGDTDYGCNNFEPTFPHGLDVEAVAFDWLERAYNEATDTFDREHVTPFIRRHPDLRSNGLKLVDEDHSAHRWTLDTDLDWKFMQTLFSHLPEDSDTMGWRNVLSVIDSIPGLAGINSGEQTPARNLERTMRTQ